ncbi:uncharacterized protein VP01_329g5 [Puccinia sorghi]|uniref:Uncharacterized protein n=1 Tax=Puccinia sorghi TaxID=27349 RepID=A0A0L6UZE2_9BASI|nr:uncharacterized protein VP01_329g5 [Puccinia sorghi]
MRVFLQTLHFAGSLTLLVHLFATLIMVAAYPLGSSSSSVSQGTPLARRSSRPLLAKRSAEEYEEDQSGVFAKGEGTDREFIWSKFSYARNYFGAGNPTKEIESMTLDLGNL